MGHVHHEYSAHLICKFPHLCKVNLSRVGAITGKQDRWLYLVDLLANHIEIQQLGVRLDPVLVHIEKPCG